MRTIFLVVLVVLSSSIYGSEPVPELKLFALNVSLRPGATAAPTFLAESPRDMVELTASRESPLELSIQRYEAMTGAPLLKIPVPLDEPGGAYGIVKRNLLDPITHPEVVKVGKVHFTGGIVGAVKRKNPFYLLNPLVFAIDW